MYLQITAQQRQIAREPFDVPITIQPDLQVHNSSRVAVLAQIVISRRVSARTVRVLPCQTLGALDHNSLVDKQPADTPNDVLVRIDVQQLQLIGFVRAKGLRQQSIATDDLFQSSETLSLLPRVCIEQKLSGCCLGTGNAVELDGVAEHSEDVLVEEIGMSVGAGFDVGLDCRQIDGLGDAFKVLRQLSLGWDAEFGGNELTVGV